MTDDQVARLASALIVVFRDAYFDGRADAEEGNTQRAEKYLDVEKWKIIARRLGDELGF